MGLEAGERDEPSQEEINVSRTIGEVVKRQLGPQLEMVRKAIESCPDALLYSEGIGILEHLYHAVVGMDIWLSDDLSAYPFDQIVDDDAAQLKAPASEAVTREVLLGILDRLSERVDALPQDDRAYLNPASIQGREFTLLDRCIGQFRHVQHHVGVANERLHAQGLPRVGWLGYGES